MKEINVSTVGLLMSFIVFGIGEMSQRTMLFAQEASQRVHLLIDKANGISVKKNEGAATLDLAIVKSEGGAGSSRLVPAYSNTISWGIKTTVDNMKITARLDAPMPANSLLFMKMSAPPKAFSERISLGDGLERDAVTGIPKTSLQDLPIEIWFYADLAAGSFSSTMRILTLTLSGQ